jgi:hypothetical protein
MPEYFLLFVCVTCNLKIKNKIEEQQMKVGLRKKNIKRDFLCKCFANLYFYSSTP